MSQNKKSLTVSAWREKVNQRCSLLDRRLIVRDHQNIVRFEITFPKERAVQPGMSSVLTRYESKPVY